MEDTDLRGFLDGRFIAAWNQPKQIHVRLGRAYKGWHRYGEWELFRVLQRWTALDLPGGAKVDSAWLELDIEQGVDRDLEILLYEVHKDWESGNGGVECNNNSAPSKGEVWWNEVGRGMSRWGLPGAGFASDSHPLADTPVRALALAHYRPGNTTIVFESKQLAAYVEKRASQGKPLLFLLKLADYLEDVPATCISVYSSNHGDSKNTARRPRLTLDWSSVDESAHFEQDVILEHGRSLVFPRLESLGSKNVAVSFKQSGSEERPTLSVRGGKGNETSSWIPTHFPFETDWTWVQVRVDAYANPVNMGQTFTAEFRDTWVRTGPPEDQEVSWTFFAPSGQFYIVNAVYVGDWCWRVDFVPKEFGRWYYRWSQNFIETPYTSAIGAFDVIPGDRDSTLDALKKLKSAVHDSNLATGRPRMRAYSVTFNRLQRGLMRHETPETFLMRESGTDGGEFGSHIDEAREVLSGERPLEPRLAINYPDGVVTSNFDDK